MKNNYEISVGFFPGRKQSFYVTNLATWKTLNVFNIGMYFLHIKIHRAPRLITGK